MASSDEDVYLSPKACNEYIKDRWESFVGDPKEREDFLCLAHTVIKLFFRQHPSIYSLPRDNLIKEIREPQALTPIPQKEGFINDPIGGWETEYPISLDLNKRLPAARLISTLQEAQQRWFQIEKEKVDKYRGVIREKLISTISDMDETQIKKLSIQEQVQVMKFRNKGILNVTTNLLYSVYNDIEFQEPFLQAMDTFRYADHYYAYSDWLNNDACNMIWRIQEELKSGFDLHIIIFDMKDINDLNRSPMIFAPANNYGFLVFDIKKNGFVSCVPELKPHLEYLRRILSEGDLIHLPFKKGDVHVSLIPGRNEIKQVDPYVKGNITKLIFEQRDVLLKYKIKILFEEFLKDLNECKEVNEKITTYKQVFITMIMELIRLGKPIGIRTPAFLYTSRKAEQLRRTFSNDFQEELLQDFTFLKERFLNMYSKEIERQMGLNKRPEVVQFIDPN